MPRAREALSMGGFLRLLVALSSVASSAYADAGSADQHTGAPPPEIHDVPTQNDGRVVTPASDAPPAPAGSAPTAAPQTQAAPALPRFDERTHFSLSWVRLPGAEECVSAKELSRAVESRLHRPALGATAETDVAIEGFIEKTDDGFHAMVTIADAHGKRLGQRELVRPVCREMDAALALTIALMIDPDAAFAPTAARPPSQRPPAPVRSPAPLAATKPVRGFRGTVEAGVAVGFGNMPSTAGGVWVLGSVTPPGFFPIEIGAHLFLDQVVTLGKETRVAFSRAVLDLALCPLDVHVGVLALGACAGAAAGTMTADGVGRVGLLHQREPIVDAMARGRLGAIIWRRFAISVFPALGVPLVHDSFDYRRNDGSLQHVFDIHAVYGEVGLGVGVELP